MGVSPENDPFSDEFGKITEAGLRARGYEKRNLWGRMFLVKLDDGMTAHDRNSTTD